MAPIGSTWLSEADRRSNRHHAAVVVLTNDSAHCLAEDAVLEVCVRAWRCRLLQVRDHFAACADGYQCFLTAVKNHPSSHTMSNWTIVTSASPPHGRYSARSGACRFAVDHDCRANARHALTHNWARPIAGTSAGC